MHSINSRVFAPATSRSTESGIARAMFRVAVSGRREQEASFFTVIVWRDQAEHAVESLAKGSRVVVVGRLRQRSWTAEDGSARWSRSWPRSWGRACGGQRRPRPGRRGAKSRRVPRRPGRRNERHPASWKLWLQDLALDDERGDCRGYGLALLCFPMSVRKDVDEEPRGHRQPGWPGVVPSGGGRDG